MSVVCCKVEKEYIEIASDSIVTRGTHQDKSNNRFSKLIEINNMIIGTAGTCEEMSLMIKYANTTKPELATEFSLTDYICEFAEWKKKRTDNHVIDNHYIFIIENKAFFVAGFFVDEILTFESIGAGLSYSQATLHLGHSVKDAVKTACELSIYCEEPIVYIKRIKNHE